MKKLTLTLCLLAGLNNTVWADEIVIAADVWCPINCEPDSDKPGYMIEMARQIFAAQGHTVKYVVLPWSRAIEEARRGDIDGIIGAYKEDAPDFIFPTLEQGMLGDVFYVKKDSDWTYNGLDSLQGKSLAVIQDYGYTDELNPYVEANLDNNAKIQAVDGEDALPINIRKLVKGRVDVVVESAPVFWYTAASIGMKDKVKAAGATAEKDQTFIAFSPADAKKEKSAEYAKLLSEGTQKLRESGALAQILAKYSLTDWQEK